MGQISGSALSRTAIPTQVIGSSPFDALRHEDDRGEHWWARELQFLLGYSVWRDFTNAIERAKITCKNSGHDVSSHFADARKVASTGPAAADYRLSRYGAYLVAMNGDPRKTEIARAQTYFAAKTREAEVAVAPQAFQIPQTFADALRLAADEHDGRLAAEAKVAELEPAATAWNVLAEANGHYLVGDAAKFLSNDPAIRIGRDRLFAVLFGELRWTHRAGDGRWRAKQSAVETGYLSEIVDGDHKHPRTGERVANAPQVRVTVKGLERLLRHLGGTRPLQIDGVLA